MRGCLLFVILAFSSLPVGAAKPSSATPRPGIESVIVKIFPDNYLSTFTIVDFDAVERWKPGTIPALLRPILHGKQSVWVDCRFQASHGTRNVCGNYPPLNMP